MWLSTILRRHWFFHMKLSSKGPICAGARALPSLLPSQSHRGRAGVVDSPVIPAPSHPVKSIFLEESDTLAPLNGAQELLN